MQVAQALPHKIYRGERMPNIVQTMKIGNSTVHIATDHIASGIELEKVHDELSQAVYAIWDSLSEEEQEEFVRESA